MKSAKKKPLESDEHGPLKHAPRPKFETLTSRQIHELNRQYWFGYRSVVVGWQCLSCSHEVSTHVLGWCEECKHDCAGCDKLHEKFRSLAKGMTDVLNDLAKERIRTRYHWVW